METNLSSDGVSPDLGNFEPRDPLADDILAAQQGDEDALGRLFAIYRNYLLKVANQLVPSDVRGKFGPSDVVQETMLQLGCRFEEFQGSGNGDLKAWMRETLVRNARNMTRNYTRTEMRSLGREIPLQTDTRPLPLPIVDAAPNSPADRLLAAEEANRLTKALSRLAEDHRQVIRLRNFDSLSFQQIGETLGRSEDAARKLWARAILRLKDELSPDAPSTCGVDRG